LFSSIIWVIFFEGFVPLTLYLTVLSGFPLGLAHSSMKSGTYPDKEKPPGRGFFVSS